VAITVLSSILSIRNNESSKLADNVLYVYRSWAPMIRIILLAISVIFCSYCASAEMLITVFDKDYKRLSNVVVELFPETPLTVSHASTQTKIMKQLDKQFVPHILAV
jgi:hypothetical protein